MDGAITFLRPAWLTLLLCLPLVVWWSVGSLSGLGRWRRWGAMLLRCLVLTAVIFTLADAQWTRKSDRVCTFFVLDQSQSIPTEKTEQAIDWMARSIGQRHKIEDLAGVVVTGKSARIDAPPIEYPRGWQYKSVGANVDRQYTDLEAGLKLALGAFPPDCAKRVVVISDGNQNRGNVLAQAVLAQQQGVIIDAVPLEYEYDSEVLVDKVVLPQDLKAGDTANLKVVLKNSASRPVSGLLKLNQVTDQATKTLVEQRLVLQPGLNVPVIKHRLIEPNFYRYEAVFEPDADAGDRLARNNQGATHTWIKGLGQILIVASDPTRFEFLAEVLRKEKLEVTIREPDQIGKSLAELRRFDAIVLANVPAEQLGDDVQQMIEANTSELGSGLVMIGGEDSFGAGGYHGTVIEKALPVDMDIKSTKIKGRGALVMIMHASEIAEGNYWQKVIAKLAIEKLGSRDECGLLFWGGKESWLFPLQPVGGGEMMKRRIDSMTPGDMPDFDPTMKLGLSSLLKSSAMVKHMIIISDGDPQPPSNAVINGFANNKITVTTVAVAAHGFTETQLMKSIADRTKGRFYSVTNAKTLPQIYTSETRVVSRPLIYERDEPWEVKLVSPTGPIESLSKLPPIRGFVMTTPKPTAEVGLSSPLPAEADVNPILAHWQHGLGRAVAFTSDAGDKWTDLWTKSDVYGQFWSQMMRWVMRPTDSANLAVSTQEKDGQVTVVVNAFDKDNDFLNFLNLQGKLIRPDFQTDRLVFKQTEPGKYEATVTTEQAGSYVVTLGYRQPDGSQGIASTGINIAYSPEYRDIKSNRELLENLARLGGGRVVDPREIETAIADSAFFRHDLPPSLRMKEAWPVLVLLLLGLFFADVANRRIALEPHDAVVWCRRVWGRLTAKPIVETTSTLERLQSKKAEVAEQIEAKKRFEVDPARSDSPSVLDHPATPTTVVPPPTASAPPSLQPKAEKDDDSYTSRLLKAKKKVWENRDENS